MAKKYYGKKNSSTGAGNKVSPLPSGVKSHGVPMNPSYMKDGVKWGIEVIDAQLKSDKIKGK